MSSSISSGRSLLPPARLPSSSSSGSHGFLFRCSVACCLGGGIIAVVRGVGASDSPTLVASGLSVTYNTLRLCVSLLCAHRGGSDNASDVGHKILCWLCKQQHPASVQRVALVLHLSLGVAYVFCIASFLLERVHELTAGNEPAASVEAQSGMPSTAAIALLVVHIVGLLVCRRLADQSAPRRAPSASPPSSSPSTPVYHGGGLSEAKLHRGSHQSLEVYFSPTVILKRLLRRKQVSSGPFGRCDSVAVSVCALCVWVLQFAAMESFDSAEPPSQAFEYMCAVLLGTWQCVAALRYLLPVAAMLAGADVTVSSPKLQRSLRIWEKELLLLSGVLSVVSWRAVVLDGGGELDVADVSHVMLFVSLRLSSRGVDNDGAVTRGAKHILEQRHSQCAAVDRVIVMNAFVEVEQCTAASNEDVSSILRRTGTGACAGCCSNESIAKDGLRFPLPPPPPLLSAAGYDAPAHSAVCGTQRFDV